MTTTLKVTGYGVRNLVRSRWLLVYTLFFFAAAEGLLRFSADGTKALLSLTSVVLFVVPLVTIVFGTVYVYGAREFTELLLAQPVRRSQLFTGLYLGLAAPLAMALGAGIAIPFAMNGAARAADAGTLAVLVFAGAALTAVFTALAFLIALRVDDRLRGVGVAIGVWLLFALFYDGLVLLLVALFADHPMEKPVLAMVLANPVDLARVLLLLRFDLAALMGYTGAVFQRLLGGWTGSILAGAALALWVAIPVAIGQRVFRRKDF